MLPRLHQLPRQKVSVCFLQLDLGTVDLCTLEAL